jgi:hypothetical protein
MDSFIIIFLIGALILLIALFIGILKWNNSLPPDHTRMSPLSRSIAQTLLVAIVFVILFFVFIL